jgi:hypothetical protein
MEPRVSAFEDAPCVGRWWLFESTDYWDHQEAAAECARCPAIEACGALLREVQADISPAMRAAGGGASGTWAGQLVTVAEPKRPQCGEDRGYYRHRRGGEDVCDACWEAHSVAEARRHIQRRARSAS